MREVLSAQLDGESRAAETATALAHLDGCDACRAWLAKVERAQRVLRVRPAETVPDVREAVFARVGARSGWHRVRMVVAVFAGVELALAVSSYAFGYGQGSAHDARHLGAFAVALAVGLIYAALHPARSLGVLPVVAALVVAMSASAVVELAAGRTTVLAEAHHVLEISALASLWSLAGCPHPSLPLPIRLWVRGVVHRER